MKRKFLCIYLPLILGVIIYIIFRSKHLFYFNLFKITDLDGYIAEMRKFVFLYRKLFPNWVVYSLPDGVWIFSFGSALLYNFDNFRQRILLFTAIFIFTILFEMLQFFIGGHGTLVGTFDSSDVICFLFGYISALIVNYICFKNNRVAERPYQQLNFLQLLCKEKINLFTFLILAFLPTLVK